MSRQAPTFYEFFAGGGMARAGLGPRWRCLLANDMDPKKAASYAANWGDDHLRLGDIHALKPGDLPGRAALAWASFPCQDLSLAGNGAGLQGKRSGAFWGFHALVEGLVRENRAPKLLVLENVVGLLTSRGGADFREVVGALVSLGYVAGALVIDAQHFLPQSRPRLFIVAARADLESQSFSRPDADPAFASEALRRAAASLPETVQKAWRWWRLPAPPLRNLDLADLIEDRPQGVDWHRPEETARLVAMMSPVHRAKLDEALASGERRIGALYRRTRTDAAGAKVQRAEVRFDGLAGCLRTPGGGSSRQFLMVVEQGRARSRLLSPREAARLMGLPEDYVLPATYGAACKLVGDGLAVPVIRFLGEYLLAPLAAGSALLAAAE